ncbi:MAG: glycosyltransferase [Thermodesulfobacteriota bacterium]
MAGKKIKVYHLITSFWTNHGPSSTLLAQIRSQAPGKFDFSIWSLYGPPPALDPRDLIKRAGLGYRVFPMGASFLDVRVLLPLVRQLRRQPPDILHCHLLRANLYGRLAGRLAGIRNIINTIHGVDEYLTRADLLSRSLRLVERLSAGWVSRYVAVSENARQAVIKHLRIAPGKVSTILNAVDLVPFQRPLSNGSSIRAELGLSPDAVVLGSVGNLLPLKNYAKLVRWFGDLAATFPQVQLVIIGEGEERRALEDLIARKNLAAKVKLPGFRADIPRVLPALDIFAFPSLSEGLSIALLEAMAAGLPCVAMDVGGNAEAVVDGRTGNVVAPGDAPGFKDALIRLVKDGELRKKLGEAGKKRAFTLFNPKRLAAQYAQLYRALLHRS